MAKAGAAILIIMEILEVLLWLFGDLCCQGFITGVIDLLAGFAGYQVHQGKAQARRAGKPSPPPGPWAIAFWILLPLGVLLTLGLLAFQAWHWF